MASKLLERLPPRQELIALFSFSAFLVYGRIFFVFAWKLPSWFFTLTLDEILSVLAYSLTFAFLESAAFTALFAIICFILPTAWFREGFLPRSVCAVATWLISWFLYYYLWGALKGHGIELIVYLPIWFVAAVLLTVATAFAAPRLNFLARPSLWLADRTIVFLFLLIPASLIGFIVVVLRNLS